MQKNKEELHPLLPSGDWEGFYCYHHNPEQHKMVIELNFSNSLVSGSGVDDVSLFTWTGNYDVEEYKIQMVKHYATHNVIYKGDIDENGIWGVWEIAYDSSKFSPILLATIKEAFKNDLTGGFHIWPRKIKVESNSISTEELNESDKLKEIFIELFT